MTAQAQLDMAAVAAHLGISYESVRRYRLADRARFGFPEPDGRIGRSPWWWPATIEEWAERRPGAGAGGGRSAKGKR